MKIIINYCDNDTNVLLKFLSTGMGGLINHLSSILYMYVHVHVHMYILHVYNILFTLGSTYNFFDNNYNVICMINFSPLYTCTCSKMITSHQYKNRILLVRLHV